MALSLWMALMFGKLSGNLHVKSLSRHSGMRRIYSAQRTELELGAGGGDGGGIYFVFLSVNKEKV